MQHLIGTLNNKNNTPVCKMFISFADTRTKSYRIHKHIEFEISLILQGTGIYDTKTGTYDIRPGEHMISARAIFSSIRPTNIIVLPISLNETASDIWNF